MHNCPGNYRGTVQNGTACLFEGSVELKAFDGCDGRRSVQPAFYCEPRGLHVVRQPSDEHASCHGCTQYAPTPSRSEYVTSEQLVADTLACVSRLPRIAAVYGIARSGMIPASLIACQLGAPLFSVDQQTGKIKECGHGWRLRDVQPDAEGATLLVDDSIYHGTAIARARESLKAIDCRPLVLAPYVSPQGSRLADVFARVMQTHVFDWNIGTAPYNDGAAWDIDGLICPDFTAEQDDDGERYLEQLTKMPLTVWRPRRPVDLVSARLERYRGPTLAWLKRHGIAFRRLVLGPWKSKAEREADDVAAWKARELKRLGSHILFESCPSIARRVHEELGINTACPPAKTAWLA